LPPDARGAAVLEVPSQGDILDLDAPDGVVLTWQARGSRPHGQALAATVRELAAAVTGAGAAAGGLDPEADGDGVLWDVPSEQAPGGSVYAWLAGEAGCIAALRRHLVADLGLDRRAVAFMGYWKAGTAEVND
jgi:NADPH-dependent ferric siderophore reductase